jgi:GNAT superfamily N-acetyltransferase
VTVPRDRQAVEVAALPPAEVPEAVGVLARGMRDNPLHVAAFGAEPERRQRRLERFFRTFFKVMRAQTPLAAHDAGTLVGVTGIAPPGTCQPAMLDELRLLPTVLAMGPTTSARMMRWVAAWAAHDPTEPHSHLGPLAVDAHLQGRGIGTRILVEYCDRLDRAGELAYLETDKAVNVRIYERHGFRVIAEERVIGVPNWFMRREPGGTAG